jgi:hypothetical protein
MISEQELLRSHTTRYQREGNRYVRSYGTLILTPAQLIFQGRFSNAQSFPLAHLTESASERFSLSDHLRITMDTGYIELFSVSSVPQWIEAVNRAKINAPEIAFVPPTSSDTGIGKIVLIVGGSILALLVCSVLGIGGMFIVFVLLVGQ